METIKNISVVVVNYNAGDCLVECIASVLSQADEIVIVDNASTDSSISACREEFSSEDKVCFVCNSQNTGFAAGCNAGLRLVSGKYVLFLNPDCVSYPGALAELKLVLNSSGCIGMVGGLLLNPDGSEQAGGRRLMPRPWSSFIHGFGMRWLSRQYPEKFPDYDLYKQPLPENPVVVEAISGACMLVKRSAVEIVGMWDEGYFLHCEDLDWCMRFGLSGLKVMFVPQAKFSHALSICSRSRKIFVEWHKHKGMLRFYRKFYKDKYPALFFAIIFLAVWARFAAICTVTTLRKLFPFGKRSNHA